MNKFVLKICTHCEGESTIFISTSAYSNKKGVYNHKGYIYLTTGRHKCAECGGAGIANYKIRTIGGEEPEEADEKILKIL